VLHKFKKGLGFVPISGFYVPNAAHFIVDQDILYIEGEYESKLYHNKKNKADIKEDIFDGEGKFKSLRM
jgi:hypothetical protein